MSLLCSKGLISLSHFLIYKVKMFGMRKMTSALSSESIKCDVELI